GEHLFALNRIAEGIAKTTLLGCDGQGSVRIEADDTIRQLRYTTHGAEQKGDEKMPFGYTGLRREPLTGWYIPNGYRPYDPLLMCFLSPDSESPFGRGGINPYVYCAGDPVNRIDPDGHSWVTWTVAAIGLAAGAIGALSSLGIAIPAVATLLSAGIGTLSASGAAAIASAALNAVSFGTGVAALALEAIGNDRQAGSVLGWISLGTGILSAVTGIAARGAQTLGKTARGPGRANLTRRASHRPAAVKRVGQTTVLFAKKGHSEVAMHENVWGTGIRAFETHGSKSGKLMNSLGKFDDPAQVALQEIAPWLGDIPADQPIMLLACYSGRSGAAQQVANVLQRPVYGYDKAILLYREHLMQSLDVSLQATNIPTQGLSLWRRLLGKRGYFLDAPTEVIASGRTYYPQL
ncbi:MAG: RHS repeat-associated core domain-containing protein, partial [Pseudomonas farsensis]|uniref:RHS repeat-associated core domain-containing protein n=1 Tax=Pseudomonas farsensis TaxID=2745492 RepID=UPI003C7BC23F